MKNIVLLTVLLCQSSLVTSQWESLHGPFGGAILELQNEGQLIFARNGNGIYRSTDGGREWQNLNLQIPPNYYPAKIVIQDTNLILACWWGTAVDRNVKLFLSKDSGNTWIEIGTPSTDKYYDFSFDGHGLYFNDKEHIWLSTDFGTSWRLSKVNLIQSSFYDLYNYDHHVFILGLDKIFESGTDLDTWKTLEVTGIDYTNRFYVFDSIYFAIGYMSGLMSRSDDKGKTWKVNNHIDWSTSSLIKIGKDFYGNQDNTLIKSIDGGKTFNNTFIDLKTRTYCMINVQDTMVLGTESGILKSTDSGSSFISMNEGLVASDVINISVKDTILLALNGGIGIAKLDLFSGNWQHVNYASKTVLDLINVDNFTFVLKGISNVIRSPDNGKTWKNVNSVPLLNEYYSKLSKDENSVLVMGNICSVVDPLVSNDYGDNWEALMGINQIPGYPNSFYNQNGTKYITTDQVIARSDNFGHWKVIKEISSQCSPYDKLIVSNKFIAYIERHIEKRAYLLWISQDQGESWKDIVPDIPSDNLYKGFYNIFFIDNNIIASSGNGILYASFDLGDSWVKFDEGMQSIHVNNFTSDETYIYAATSGKGVWRRKISDLYTTSTQTVPQQNEISIFPNPSNGNFTINLNSQYSGEADLVITDLSGKVCLNKEIVLGPQMKIEAENLLSGLYFLSLRAGGKKYIGKMVIQK